MGTMAQLYLRCDDDKTLEDIRRDHPGARIEAPSRFCSIEVPLDGPWMEAAAVQEASRKYHTEAIFLAFASAAEGFNFIRCRRGMLYRQLEYGPGEWGDVEGQAEPWEAKAFFARDIKHYFDPDPVTPDVERIYREQIITPGAHYPVVDARESARVAAVHYRLTDWLDDWLSPRPSDNTTSPLSASSASALNSGRRRANLQQRLIGAGLTILGLGMTAYQWKIELAQGPYSPKASFLMPVCAFLGLSILLFPISKEEVFEKHGSTQLAWSHMPRMQRALIVMGFLAGAANYWLSAHGGNFS